jgi:hypothetical protein
MVWPSSKKWITIKPHAVAFVALAALAIPAVAGAGKVYLEDSLPKVGSTQVIVTGFGA